MQLSIPSSHLNSEEAACMSAALREALRAIEETLEKFAVDAPTILQRAEPAVAEVRDILILRLRQADAGEARDAIRAVLNQVNVSISLMMSIAYPQGDQKKEALEQAREILQKLEQSLS